MSTDKPEHMADSSKYMFGLLITCLIGMVSYVWVSRDSDVNILAEKVGELAVSTGALNANFAIMLDTNRMNNKQLTAAIIDLRTTVADQAPASIISINNKEAVEKIQDTMWSSADHEAYAARTDVRKDQLEETTNRIKFEIEKIKNYLKLVHDENPPQFED